MNSGILVVEILTHSRYDFNSKSSIFIISGEQNHWLRAGAPGGLDFRSISRCMQYVRSAKTKSFVVLSLLL